MKYILFLFVFCFFYYNVCGQTTNKQIHEIINLSAKEFDYWIDDQRAKRMEKKEFLSFDALGEIIVKRLKEGQYTTNYSVLRCLDFYRTADFSINNDITNLDGKQEKVNSYHYTINFIDDILKIIYRNEYLRMKLLKEKVELLKFNKKSAENDLFKFEVLESFSDKLTMLNLELDLLENDVNLDIGYLYNVLDENRKMANKYYGKVLHYPFSFVEGELNYQNFKSQYIQAAERRIYLYRNDLFVLRQTVFHDETDSELLPILKEAIEEAGGSWDEYLKYWEDEDFEYGIEKK